MFNVVKRSLSYLLALLIALPISLLIGTVKMALASTAVGPNSGSNFSYAWYGSAVWNTTGNASVSDNQYATCTANNSVQVTSYFKAEGFGFNIPAGSTINGVTVNLERSQTGSGTSFYDEVALLIRNDAINYAQSYNRSTGIYWPASDGVITYGGSNDLWGQSWTVDDINNSKFGFAIAARKISGTKTAKIDYVSITVNYTTPDTTAPVIDPHGDVTAEATSSAGAIVSYDAPLATDNVDATAPAICAPASGSQFAVGSTPITCNKTDAAGNVALPTTFNVIVQDTTAPTINSISSSPNTTGETATVTTNATDNTGIASALINLGSGFVSMSGSGPDYTYDLLIPSGSLTPINYVVQFSDGYGNSTTSPLQTINPTDNDKPTITSVSGTVGTTGEVTSISVEVIDNIAPTAAKISFDYGSSWLDMTGGASPFTYDYLAPTGFTGIVDYRVKVLDAAGNESDEVLSAINVTDNDAPSGSITINGGDTYTNSGTVNLTLPANDNIGVSQMCVKTGTFICTTSGLVAYQSPYTDTFGWVTSDVKNVYVWYKDAAGNISPRYSDSITYDNGLPSIPGTPISLPNPTNLLTQNWSWGASSDATSSVKGYYIRIVGTTNIGPVFIGGTTDYVTNLAQGLYRFFVSAIDFAGNQSAESYQDIIVDTTAPTTPVADPPAGEYLAGVQVNLKSSDNNGIGGIYYTLDGSQPDQTSTPYSSPINISRDMTLRAISYDGAGNASDVMTADYQIAPTISLENSGSATASSATITWVTNQPSTSRVVYDTVTHPVLGAAPNYGYAFSTVEDSTKTTNHSVTITSLSEGTTYYFRVISHGSPEAVGSEKSFATTSTQTVNPGTTDTAQTITGTVTVATPGLVATTQRTDAAAIASSAEPSPTSSASISPAGDSNEVTSEVKGEQTGGQSQSKGWWWWIIGAIVVIAAGGTIYWFAKKRNSNEE